MDARREWDGAFKAMCQELGIAPRGGGMFEAQLLRALAAAERRNEDIGDLPSWLMEHVGPCPAHTDCVVHAGIHWKDL